MKMFVCGQVHLKPSVPQLFSSSEDEEDGDEEEDGSRFDIRPQFEGPAGQKVRKGISHLAAFLVFFSSQSDHWVKLLMEELSAVIGRLLLMLFVCLLSS